MSGAGRPNEQQPPPPPFPTGLAPPTQPPLALPQRSSVDTLFASSGSSGAMFDMGLGLGFSPGPMTMASRFFSDNGEECKSFSQLLTGAMASPTSSWLGFMNAGSAEKQLNDGGLQFKQTRPDGMALPPPSPMMFAVSPGLSPAALLDSPGIFPVTPGHSGAMRQQGLVIHAVAQASQAHPSHHSQAGYAPSSSAASSAEIMAQIPLSTMTTTMHQLTSSHLEESKAAAAELPDLSCLDHRSLAAAFAVDKPADDGYNWRKYGQKQVKGSEFPRSYYKCTQPSCPVKKKVERSLDGHITEIIYKGQHNHQPPKNNKRTRDSGMACGSSDIDENSQAPLASMSKGRESSQVNPGNLSGTSDSEEVGDAETGAEDRDEDEPSPKRRSTEVTVLEAGCSHRTVTEPKIIVQTTSEVDLLDDGYRWRKYGQKVVKGNPHPRSYYKCTTPGCNVRKHIERASSDPKAVITTYEGKHNHDVPAAKPSSHTIASNYASRSSQQQHVETQKHELTNNITFSLGTTSQQPVAPQQLKQEQTT